MYDDMSVNGRYVWSPYSAPSHPEKPPPISTDAIRIRHPGYPDSCNTLLKFYPHDDGGVHSETARLACAVITDAWDGYLSEEHTGESRIEGGPDTILRRKSYYFHTNASDIVYAVTPNFSHWPYPHGKLPSSYRNIPSFSQVSRPPNDMSCRLTQCDYAVENAHLIPSAQQEWFNKNCMHEYIPSTATDKMNHPTNLVRLRSDIHLIFDAKRFAIVPMGYRLVVYCFNEEPGSQVARQFHGVELHRLHVTENSTHFLLARFAYTVFEHFRSFLDSNVPRRLRLQLKDGVTEQVCDEEKCQAFARATAMQGKSRSASPKKRQRQQGSDDALDGESLDDEYYRGRKRRRSSHSSTFTPSDSFGSTNRSDDVSIATPEATPTLLQPVFRSCRPPRSLGEESPGGVAERIPYALQYPGAV